MVAGLIGACFAIACLLFVASLPIAGTGFGKSLRSFALFFFILALAPAVIVGACRRITPSGPNGSGPSAESILAGIGVLAIFSVAAYLALALKGKAGKGREKHNDGGRSRRGYRHDQRRSWDEEPQDPDDL